MQDSIPVFPVMDLTTLGLGSSSTNLKDSGDDAYASNLPYIERLSRAHEQLTSLPTELAPSSCPSSPQLESRVDLIREKLLDAVNTSNGEPSNPKWGHVYRMLRMACTSREYHGAASSVRVGDSTAVDTRGFQWVLPDTEEEWNECEKRWKERSHVTAGKQPEIGSKYWTKEKIVTRKTSILLMEEEWPKTRSQRVREKVENWQAQLAHIVEETPSSQTPSIGPAAEPNSQNNVPPHDARKEIPLTFTFTVSKHALAGLKPSSIRGAASKDAEPLAVKPLEVQQPVVETDVAQPAGLLSESMAEQKAVNITDVSEMNFLPPSFPSYLQTSTPQDTIVKSRPPSGPQKPPPIYQRPLLSSPLSPPFTPSSDIDHVRRVQNNKAPLAPSSSSPTHSPRAELKRSRPLSPADNDDPFISRPNVPPMKRKRMGHIPEPELLSEPVNERISSAPPPASTPPPRSGTPSLSRSKTPSPPAHVQTKDLGNAIGLPIPSTPDRNKALPRLSQLLASSRRSRPRPRPPSRKAKSVLNTPSRRGPRVVRSGADVEIQDTHDNQDKGAYPVDNRTPSPVRTVKTFFSSPASGSSESTPQSIRQKRLGSPGSPLPTSQLKMDQFVPPFVSTQKFGGSTYGTPAEQLPRTQTGLIPPAPSGLLGYSSQFDVDRHVDELNELLERDVDFDGWLRDIPEVEAEMDATGSRP